MWGWFIRYYAKDARDIWAGQKQPITLVTLWCIAIIASLNFACWQRQRLLHPSCRTLRANRPLSPLLPALRRCLICSLLACYGLKESLLCAF
jgi:hypothetical protein